MAWNTPGSSSGGSGNNGNRNNSWKPRNRQGGGIGDVVERLRGLFGGIGGGGNPLRWVLLGIGLLVLFSSFQLIGEQQRGVVLRFGQYNRTMQPGPNFKFPWPIESVTKVNATGVRTFSNSLPVLTRDENIVSVEINVQYRIGDAQLYLFGTRNADEVLKEATLSAVREQVGQPVVVDFVHQGQQAPQVVVGEAFPRKPVQVIARQIGNHTPLVLAIRHLHSHQPLQRGRVHARNVHGSAPRALDLVAQLLQRSHHAVNVIALHFNLQPQVVAPRKLHKPGILHWCIADEGVFVGDHDDVVASLAHVSSQPLLARLEATQGLKLFEVEFRHG